MADACMRPPHPQQQQPPHSALPESVERLLTQICADKSQPPPNDDVRSKLGLLSEEKALELLRDISNAKAIRSLNGFIVYMLRKPQYSSASKSPSPHSHPQQQQPPHIALPESVECLLTQICADKSQPSPNDDVRRNLGLLSEEKALELLRDISNANAIRTLDGFIVYMMRKPQYSSLSKSPAPSKSVPTTTLSQFKSPVVPLCTSSSSKLQGETLRLAHNKSCVVLDQAGDGHNGRGAELEALGELEFRKQFLILNYAGGRKLEDVIEPETIRSWKDLPMQIFETRVWETVGQKYIGHEDRRYRFFVFKDGGKEEKKKNPTSSPVKCYFVRVESDASIDTNGGYKLSNRTVYEARSLFMHAHTVSSVANYMARFSLILSKTISFQVDLSLVDVQFLDEDEYCRDESGNLICRDGKPLIHTDGTGFISEDLALLCPKNLFKGKSIKNEQIKSLTNPDELEHKGLEKIQPGSSTRELPLLIQFRLFHKGNAVKGTFLLNKMLPPKTIQIRPSMVKVPKDRELSDDETVNSLEIVRTSNPPGKSYLSKNLIALLFHGGVPKEYFMDILTKALEDPHGAFCNRRAAIKVAINHGDIDDCYTTARMILCGIPLEESYLQHRLSELMKAENNGLKRGKLHIPECYYLMGTADPTGTLEKDEVCVILDNGQMSGKVLVYRNPGVHFGDIHVLKATYVEELGSIIGNSKYAIFFSCKGPRNVADEISGGDFDGDLYWVSRNPQLLEYFKPSEPWVPASSTPKAASVKPAQLSKEDLEDELIKLFLTTRFKPSYAMSEAADNWMAMMDRYLTLGDNSVDEKNRVKANILRLVDLYSEALDAPKDGGKVEVPEDLKVQKFPHYMERNSSYNSTSILGSIYDTVNAYQAEDPSIKGVEKLPIFDVEVPEKCLSEWKERYTHYRRDMTSAMENDDKEVKNQAADEVIRKYKEILYGGGDFDKCTRPMDEIFQEACAIYNVCYDYAKSKGDRRKCRFAWKVAGSALFKLHFIKQNGNPFLVSPSVLKDIL